MIRWFCCLSQPPLQAGEMDKQESHELPHMEIQSIVLEKEQLYALTHDHQVPDLGNIQNPTGHSVKQSALSKEVGLNDLQRCLLTTTALIIQSSASQKLWSRAHFLIPVQVDINHGFYVFHKSPTKNRLNSCHALSDRADLHL